MLLSQPTLEVLKNFSVIQNSIVIPEGNVIYTIHADRTIVARAEISETFDRRVPIMDGFSQFLNTLRLFDEDPEIVLDETFMTVTKGKQSQLFKYSDELYIVKPKIDPLDNDAKFNYDFSFTISDENLTKIKKAASILGLPNIVIRGKNGKVSLVACNATGKHGSSDNEFELDVGVETKAEFQIAINIGNILVLGRDYEISVAASNPDMKITKWASIDKEGSVSVTYWIVVEAEISYYRSN